MQKNNTLQIRMTIVEAQIARSLATQKDLQDQDFGGDMWDALYDEEAKQQVDLEKKKARLAKTIYTCEDFF